MKQLILMIVLTAAGTLGALVNGPFWGLAVYYLFAVLRPQFMWQWVLPPGIQWSLFVALATLAATALHGLGYYSDPDEPQNGRRFHLGHLAILSFMVWLGISYGLAHDRQAANFVVTEYSKIFTMMLVSALIVRQVWQVWTLMLLAVLPLCYIAYEVNFMYLVKGYLGIYLNGYGGLDNNGAGLMLAMVIPLCIFIWEGHKKVWRWFFAAMVPITAHAVLMTYSRGAMVALLVVSPLIYARSRRKKMMTLAFVAMAIIIPILAGAEIRHRFFSVEQYEQDRSAQSRFSSWRAGLKIALDYPIFGIGPRNSKLVIFAYGADMERRTIHSQYVQLAADNGFVGLACYLSMLVTAWWQLRRVRINTREDMSPTGRHLHAMACGLESSLAVFCTGALFLSLEVFELPYLIVMLSMQLPLAAAALGATAPEPVPVARPSPSMTLAPAVRRATGPLR
jgi:probable O-glycosylation ligase (exosortase A-associated)